MRARMCDSLIVIAMIVGAVFAVLGGLGWAIGENYGVGFVL